MAFIACEAAGPKRIDTATASMSDTKDMLTRGGTEVTGALAAAEAIGVTPDLKASYESFSKSLETLEKTADQVRDRWASLTAKAQTYTDTWQKEADLLKSEAARTAAATRRDSFTARITASALRWVKSRPPTRPLWLTCPTSMCCLQTTSLLMESSP